MTPEAEIRGNASTKKIAFLGLFLLTALPFVSSASALIAGLLFSLVFGNPFTALSAKSSKFLLKLSVIGLGFGVNFIEVVEVGKDSLLLTLISISATIVLGEFFGKLMKLPLNTRTLVSFGTAICGGSAIAAMAPVIKARDDEIAVSLATIFSLNAIALIIFPPLGHFFDLSQNQFGLWAALAIGASIGLLVPLVQYAIEHLVRLDDSTSAIATFAIPAVCGLLAVGLVADGHAGRDWNLAGANGVSGVAGYWVVPGAASDWPGQFQAQAVGALAIVLISFFLSWILFATIQGLTDIRFDAVDEY